MKIIFYNILYSKIKLEKEINNIHLSLLLSDCLTLESIIPVFYRLYNRLPFIKDELIVDNFGIKFKHIDEAYEFSQEVKISIPFYKRVKQKRNKSKAELKFIDKYNKAIKMFRDELIAQNDHFLNHFELMALLPFIEDKTFLPVYDEYEGDDNQEHKYIKDIANVLINRENILLLDQYIEEIFPYSKLPSFDKASNGFIKIPLWDFPFIKGLSYLELKYTKEELKQILVPFKSGLKELSEQLSVLSYSEDNFTQIEQIVKDKILNDIAPIQLSINESLYLCKLRNQQGDKSKFKLCLGISSAENIVSFYEKAEILLPYVANETKQNLIKHMDINTCSVFMYYEIHYPDPE